MLAKKLTHYRACGLLNSVNVHARHEESERHVFAPRIDAILGLGAISLAPRAAEGQISGRPNNGEISANPTRLVSLDGDWLFRTDAADSGTNQAWYSAEASR